MEHLIEIAQSLSSFERAVLAKAGEPRWFRLPHPWQPAPGRQTVIAHHLATPLVGLLCAVPEYLGAYTLTPLGEQVAGWLLRQGSLIATDGTVIDLIWRLTPLQRDVLCTVATLGQRITLNPRVTAVAVGLANSELGLLAAPAGGGFTLTGMGHQVLDLLLEEVSYAAQGGSTC